MNGTLGPVERTSPPTAAPCAGEGGRENRLFEDPCAPWPPGEAGLVLPHESRGAPLPPGGERGTPGTPDHNAIRTRSLDECLSRMPREDQAVCGRRPGPVPPRSAPNVRRVFFVPGHKQAA